MDIPLLTSGESKVYLSLIELGSSSVGNIIKKSRVSHSKIYDILERLSQKGLVSSSINNGKQYFSAADASRLKALVDEEKNKIQETERTLEPLIKQINLRKNSSAPTSLLSSYEGIKGMKTVLESILLELNKNEEVLMIGSPKQMGEQAGGYLKDWQKRRINSGAICKIITDVDAISWDEEWWEKSKKQKITFTKKSTSISPSYIIITKYSVTTIYFSTHILSFVVRQEDIAKKYKEFFTLLWNGLR